jgi:ceramide glucosyltransferase
VIWLAIPALAAGVYYLLALIAAGTWTKGERQPETGAVSTGISILKAVHGRDPGFYESIRSHAQQDYPKFEMLFGVHSWDDPAVPDIERLAREFPSVPIQLHVVATSAPNAKVGTLAGLAPHARHPLLLINDSDIRVPRGYLKTVAAPFAKAQVGLVSCFYRAVGESRAARWEALGIATEFVPSVMVARLLGAAEFALGSTMVLRAGTLQEIGGFESLAGYLADDYQLGYRVSRRGYKIHFAPLVVETNLGAGSWADVWRHQLRWSRTVRASRPGGYVGYAVTHATFWSIVAFGAGQWRAGALALGLRMAAGIWIGGVILEDPNTARAWWLIPLRDLLGFAVWLAGLFGDTVDWRGQKLRLRPDGRIQKA